ncbi:host attachment family protein [Coralliovum pocilloporae]|uniref:host attachment family protein n=1 Tax=Coralliovum pocilloporae TaxID=3066369 RepID=UPI003306A754
MKSITIKQDAWILVCDGEKALFLKNAGDEVFPNFIVQRVMEHDGSDAPSDGHETGKAELSNWYHIEKHRFAVELSDFLYKAAHKNRFKHLVLVAPPRVLGDLRKELHKEVSARLIGELSKDLTHHTVADIEAIVCGKELEAASA